MLFHSTKIPTLLMRLEGLRAEHLVIAQYQADFGGGEADLVQSRRLIEETTEELVREIEAGRLHVETA